MYTITIQEGDAYTITTSNSAISNTVITVTEVGPIGPAGPSAPLRLAPFVGEKPGPLEEIWRFVAPEDYTIVQARCKGNAGINATANSIFKLYNNSIEIGTYTFTPANAVANVLISNTAVSEDDVLTLIAPQSVDSTLADIAFVLYGTVNT